MDAAVHLFFASLPLLALDPKLLLSLTKHHLRFFRADYLSSKIGGCRVKFKAPRTSSFFGPPISIALHHLQR